MKKISLLLFASILATTLVFTSCSKDDDEDNSAPPTSNEVTENITSNTTWESNNIYIIDGTLYIDNATLTIEPGAIVKFKNGAQIEVGNSQSGSAIIANGTESKPILFTSYADAPTAGDWDCIFFENGTANTTSFKYCTFEYGGGYSSSYGTLSLIDAEITMENCIVRHGENYGITLNNDSKFISFINNKIEQIENHLIKIYPNATHTIGSGNILTPVNSALGILINGGTYDQADETWLAQTCSYIIDGTLYVQKNSGTILNIQEGTKIGFTNGSQIEVGYASSTYGTIRANGTEEKPILFTSSAVSKTAGDWDCIFLEGGTSNNSIFKYCTFEYGGGYSTSYGMVSLLDCDVAFENCTFTNSAQYGVTLNSSSSFVSFQNNSFSDCSNHPIKIYGNYAHTIGTGNTYNSTLGILVSGDVYEQTNETWKKQACPYYINGTLNIGSSSGSVLTIEAGNKILFTGGSQIEVGSTSSTYGKIIAQGTASQRIIFSTSAPTGSGSAGDWDCIFLEDGTSSGTIFDNCDFSYGGGYSSSYGTIALINTGNNVTISNSTISYSANHGISSNSGSTPTITNVTYSNISGEDYKQY